MKLSPTRHLDPELAAFLECVRSGSVKAAAGSLGLSQPALSTRLKRFQKSTGLQFLRKDGRYLRPTAKGMRLFDAGMRVLRACEAMDASMRGGRLQESLLRVGTADAVPKVVVRELLAPYIRAGMRVECREWRQDLLERELLEHRLDLLITDRQPLRLNDEDLACHSAGRSDVFLCGTRELARCAHDSTDGASLSLGVPAQPSPLRERMDRWIARHAPRARIVVEAEDRALLNHFAQTGLALIPVPTTVVGTVCKQFGIRRVMKLEGVHESYYRVFSRSRLPAII